MHESVPSSPRGVPSGPKRTSTQRSGIGAAPPGGPPTFSEASTISPPSKDPSRTSGVTAAPGSSSTRARSVLTSSPSAGKAAIRRFPASHTPMRPSGVNHQPGDVAALWNVQGPPERLRTRPQRRRDVAPAVEDTPDVNGRAALHAEDHVGIGRERPRARAGEVHFLSAARGPRSRMARDVPESALQLFDEAEGGSRSACVLPTWSSCLRVSANSGAQGLEIGLVGGNRRSGFPAFEE